MKTSWILLTVLECFIVLEVGAQPTRDLYLADITDCGNAIRTTFFKSQQHPLSLLHRIAENDGPHSTRDDLAPSALIYFSKVSESRGRLLTVTATHLFEDEVDMSFQSVFAPNDQRSAVLRLTYLQKQHWIHFVENLSLKFVSSENIISSFPQAATALIDLDTKRALANESFDKTYLEIVGFLAERLLGAPRALAGIWTARQGSLTGTQQGSYDELRLEGGISFPKTDPSSAYFSIWEIEQIRQGLCRCAIGQLEPVVDRVKHELIRPSNPIRIWQDDQPPRPLLNSDLGCAMG